MNASTVHSPLFYKYTSCSFNVAAKASTSKKQLAVLHNKGEVGEYVLLSESEGSLSGLEFDNNNELDDRALLDVVVKDGSNEGDSVTQDFVWKNMQTIRDKGTIS
jgi:hypothetical protein